MMVRKPWLKILLMVLLWSMLGGVAMAQPSLTQHPVYLVHPGSVEGTPKEYCLIEQKSGAGQSRYYMDVESVICGSKVCKVVTVRLFWDELGRYTHFDMPAGMALEKEEGEAFTQADYDKLQQILANPFSPLQDVYKEDLVDPASDYNAIDALSGATVTIDQTAIVKGAVWTCYTLWHWAHGPVVAYIRDHTGRAYAVEELLVWLSERDSPYQVLALEQLTKRKAYGDSEINAVEQIALKTESLFSASLCYFEKAPWLYMKELSPCYSSVPQLPTECAT
ncbi:hypothetical protein CLV98_105141 [Dyadobacter jejuensis]|uniref:Uncharacterized protein n=1 Tax=Dyadobacter jejuensis TaxID=1082580 RepID=A0A316AK41_9BACT|nr:hypothetical protein [Dyadobacter jejuensis]PWJ57961.1 hypothetical protein CLV98_105141 [Dyadobacter jejuensis]